MFLQAVAVLTISAGFVLSAPQNIEATQLDAADSDVQVAAPQRDVTQATGDDRNRAVKAMADMSDMQKCMQLCTKPPTQDMDQNMSQAQECMSCMNIPTGSRDLMQSFQLRKRRASNDGADVLKFIQDAYEQGQQQRA